MENTQLPEVELDITTANTSFAPSTCIEGKVTISPGTSQDLFLKSIVVELIRDDKVAFNLAEDERIRQVVPASATQDQVDNTLALNSSVVLQKLLIWENSSADEHQMTKPIEAGTSADFPFELYLSSSLQPSTCTEEVSMDYFLNVKIVTLDNLQMSKSISVQIQQFPMIESKDTPVSQNVFFSISSCGSLIFNCCSPQQISLSLSLNASYYFPGDLLTIFAHCSNFTESEISSIDVDIIRSVVVYESVKKRKVSVNDKLFHFKHDVIEAKQSSDFVVEFQLPADVLINVAEDDKFVECAVFSIKYFLRTTIFLKNNSFVKDFLFVIRKNE